MSDDRPDAIIWHLDHLHGIAPNQLECDDGDPDVGDLRAFHETLRHTGGRPGGQSLLSHGGDEGAATPAVLAIVLAIAGVFAGLSLVVSKTFATWCIGTVIVLCALGFFCEAMSRLTGEREHSRSRRARHRPSTNSAGAAGNAVGTISPRPRTPVRSGAPIACINAPLCALPNGHRGQCTKAREAHVEVVCRSTANEVTPTTREDMLHGVDAMFRRLHAPPGPYDWAVDVSEAEWAERFWRMAVPQTTTDLDPRCQRDFARTQISVALTLLLNDDLDGCRKELEKALRRLPTAVMA